MLRIFYIIPGIIPPDPIGAFSSSFLFAITTSVVKSNEATEVEFCIAALVTFAGQ